MTRLALATAGLTAAATLAAGADFVLHGFRKIQLTDQFWCEGAAVGDFNHDGVKDVAGGPFWWEGPDFKIRHEFRPATQAFKIKKPDGSEVTIPGYKGALSHENDYSDNFLTYVHDLNGDGWDDILVYGWPGKPSFWYENPKGKKAADGTEHWAEHLMIDVLDNESPAWGALTGDGKPEIVCNSRGFLGYATPDWSHPEQPFRWHSISPKGTWHRYTHGIGFGDINGDGRADLVEANGWWEQPASLAGDPVWTEHKFPFAPGAGTAGGCQMHVYDFNGDGLNDVLTTLDPHGYGLVWYEQVRDGNPDFKQHLIVGREPKDNKYGVKFSQMHSIDLVDMDGDGIKDIVTGKRFWAHGPKADAEPDAPAVLYWFKTVRNPDKTVDFIPHLIDNDSGVGTQVMAADVNGDGLPDVIVGNKKGVFVFLHEVKKVSQEEWEKAQPKPIQP